MKKQTESIDPRHYPIRTKIDELYQARYHVSVPNWPALVKGLSTWLNTVPQWSLSVCLGCVENRFRSTYKPNLPPHAWVRHLSDYMTSPLDQYYQPLPDKPVPRRIFKPIDPADHFERSDPPSDYLRRMQAELNAWQRFSHETGKSL